MAIQIANNALSNCNSIDQVVELVNRTGSDASAEMIAAAYAIDGAKENGYGMDREHLEVYLSALHESGAEFNYQKAREIAEKHANEQ